MKRSHKRTYRHLDNELAVNFAFGGEAHEQQMPTPEQDGLLTAFDPPSWSTDPSLLPKRPPGRPGAGR